MAKKSRRRRKQYAGEPIPEGLPMPPSSIAAEVATSFLEDVEDPGLARVSESAGEPMEPPLHRRLELMKEGVQRARSDVADTIVQLEEWRAQIDATLAYLRGSK